MPTRLFLLLLALPLVACRPGGGGSDDDDSAADDDDSAADDDDSAADDDDATADDDDATADDDDATADDDDDGPPRVVVETSLGSFTVQTFPDEAPATVANFLTYVDEGFYDGSDGLGATIFHRVIAGFVAQGGGMTAGGQQKATHPPIVNEAIASGLSNTRGTLAMARTSVPDSATSQWYVNLVDNGFLDPGQSTPAGYAVFAEVVAGMDVVDALGAVATDANDRPVEDVVMLSVARE